MTLDGVLKIADFGMARLVPLNQNNYTRSTPLTTPVVTLWYRAPELLLGATEYTNAIDLWSVGCVLAEFWTRKPLLPAQTEQSQIMNILKLCGSITLDDWPEANNLSIYRNMKLSSGYKRSIESRMQVHKTPARAVELIDKLLTLNPAKRIDCDGALDDIFFFSAPWPSDLREFMKTLRTVKWTK